ncbi:hypothetical protein Dimus_001504, partial [Dionaea muscipula]
EEHEAGPNNIALAEGSIGTTGGVISPGSVDSFPDLSPTVADLSPEVAPVAAPLDVSEASSSNSAVAASLSDDSTPCQPRV